MRDFEQFRIFCYRNRNVYQYLAYKGAFERVERFEDHNREGHYMQLFYAIFDFYQRYPEMKNLVGPPPFEIIENDTLFSAWKSFISDQSNDNDGFTTASLLNNLSHSCGGNRTGGGGWSPIAKILFPAIAKYVAND